MSRILAVLLCLLFALPSYAIGNDSNPVGNSQKLPAPGTSGNVLKSNGSIWQSAAASGGTGPLALNKVTISGGGNLTPNAWNYVSSGNVTLNNADPVGSQYVIYNVTGSNISVSASSGNTFFNGVAGASFNMNNADWITIVKVASGDFENVAWAPYSSVYPVAIGGTGGNSGPTARAALGAAASGANSDITSLTGLNIFAPQDLDVNPATISKTSTLVTSATTSDLPSHEQQAGRVFYTFGGGGVATGNIRAKAGDGLYFGPDNFPAAGAVRVPPGGVAILLAEPQDATHTFYQGALLMPVGGIANGSSTLVAGTKNITCATCGASSLIFVQDTSGNVANLGQLYVTKNSGNFDVTSSNGADTSNFDWFQLK